MVRKVIIGSIILISVVIAYNLIMQIVAASKSGERLSQSVELVSKLESKNRELKKQLTQTQSSDFIEEQARDKLGLSKKGETIIIIPEDKLKLVMGGSQSAQIRLPNWLGWLKLFF